MNKYCKECSHTRDHKIHDLSNITNRHHTDIFEHPFSAQDDPDVYLAPEKRTLLLAKILNLLQENAND